MKGQDWPLVQGSKDKKPVHANNQPTDDRIDKEDYFNAPVIWVKKIFKCPRDELISNIETAFSKAGMENVKVVELYTTSNRTKDHAYILLNSKKASDLLLDGTINVKIRSHDDDDEDDDEEINEVTLWFDIADHLRPKENQEECVIFIQGLPDQRPAMQIAQELRRKISTWCPIEDIDVPSDKEGKGMSTGIAKIKFKFGFDAQKSIYLLNYSLFLGHEIRVSFCNMDRVYSRRNRNIESNRNKTPSPENIEDSDVKQNGDWVEVKKFSKKK